jgi:acylphosphatase
MDLATKRAHVFIKGLVQGVFFRSSTRSEAVRLGVTGWVKNLWDGRVEAVFEGDEEKVKQMIEWCHHGPPGAHVTGVEVIWEEPTGEFSDFRIEY